MKNYELKNATLYENGVVTALLGVKDVRIQDCTVAKLDDGKVVAWPPQERYEKDEKVTYKKVVTWNGEAMNAAAAALVENPTNNIRMLDNPFDIANGKKIAFATMTGDCTAKVTVFINEKGEKNLALPSGEKFTNKDGVTKTPNLVWPFKTTGDELKAEIAALIDEIVENAVEREVTEG